MKYQHITSPELVVEAIVQMIVLRLQKDKSVLWLISGGSSLDVAVMAAQQLKNQPKLAVMQVDERFGPVGHPNSNWQQFIDKGFDPGKFSAYPILKGKGIEETTKEYSELLSRVLNQTDYKIGLFGMGNDGHTAGILPRSVAADEQNELVVHYQAPDFNRITITAPVIASLDVAVLYARGKDKTVALAQLEQDESVVNQPAQVLKQAKELYVYTN
jgi:6-phosphogluconolactonase